MTLDPQDIIYTVNPVTGGWTVRQLPDGEPLMFLSGGRAEAAAVRLATSWWQTGAPAQILIHDRQGRLVGERRFGA